MSQNSSTNKKVKQETMSETSLDESQSTETSKNELLVSSTSENGNDSSEPPKKSRKWIYIFWASVLIILLLLLYFTFEIILALISSDNTFTIFLGFIANCVTAIFFFLLTWTIYFVFIVRERSRLLRFLGVSHKSPNLNILLSRLEIKPGGTEPAEGETIREGYKGAAIAKPEYDAAVILCNKINPKWLAAIPNSIRDYLSHKRLGFIRLETKIDISPKKIDAIPKTNLILIGSSVYNIATKFYLEKSKSFEFALKDETASGGEYERLIILQKLGMEDTPLRGRSQGRELGIIQRIRYKDKEKKKDNVVIICAGLGDQSTFGSTKYLAENMVKLATEYKQRQFGICLMFEMVGNDVLNSSSPIVIEEVLLDS